MSAPLGYVPEKRVLSKGADFVVVIEQTVTNPTPIEEEP